uniref:Uncharacterized protein n=1 Tax=Cacopsylla melanoneura TaxID=428564 RepID=A0A8D8TLZ1_9HEMI
MYFSKQFFFHVSDTTRFQLWQVCLREKTCYRLLRQGGTHSPRFSIFLLPLSYIKESKVFVDISSYPVFQISGRTLEPQDSKKSWSRSLVVCVCVCLSVNRISRER